jgi:hypothetical protein
MDPHPFFRDEHALYHCGCYYPFLDLGIRARSWLIELPFVGVFMDIAAMWLKIYTSRFSSGSTSPAQGFAGWFLFISTSERWLNGSNHFPASHDNRSCDNIFEFSHIARPFMLHEKIHRPGCKAFDELSV